MPFAHGHFPPRPARSTAREQSPRSVSIRSCYPPPGIVADWPRRKPSTAAIVIATPTIADHVVANHPGLVAKEAPRHRYHRTMRRASDRQGEDFVAERALIVHSARGVTDDVPPGNRLPKVPGLAFCRPPQRQLAHPHAIATRGPSTLTRTGPSRRQAPSANPRLSVADRCPPLIDWFSARRPR